MILVDTNVWREVSHANGNQRVRQWLSANSDKLILSAVVLGEIRFGIAYRTPGKKKTLLSDWADRLEEQFAGQILPFDAAAAHQFGLIAAELKKAGQNVGEIDIQIAAQAALHGLTVATRNVRDFQLTGVPLINPWID